MSMRRLIDPVVDENEVIDDGKTRLFKAVQSGDLEAIEAAIVRSGAYFRQIINDRNLETGRNVLHEAAAHGHREVVALLLSKGADIERKTILGKQTALHLAAYYGHRTVCFLLLARGALIDSRDKHGYTPLHRANSRSIVKMLLDHRAPVLAKGRDGKTALDFAVEQDKDPVTIQLLTAYTKNEDIEFYREFAEREVMKFRSVAMQREYNLQRMEEEKRERFLDAELKKYQLWRQGVNKKSILNKVK